MGLIDKEQTYQTLSEYYHHTGTLQHMSLREALDRVHMVDAVPVIRCKDCKFSKAYYHGPESNLGMFTYLCTQGLYGMNADDYCSMAIRRDA